MKRTIILSLLIMGLTCSYIFGQVADGITYQAVALDERGREIPGVDINGKIIHSRAIGVRFSIIESAQSGDMLYQETHESHTDHNGLFSVVIGHGELTGTGYYTRLTDIPWGNSPLFLKVEIDIRNRGDFKLMGIQQMMAVPFAFHALNASNIENIEEDDPVFNAWDKSTGIEITESQITDLQDYLIEETDPLFQTWDKSEGITISESQITDLQNYLTNETDPLFSAWDKSTGIVISEVQISDLGNYLTIETDPLFTAWDKSTGIEITESQITDLKNYLTDETDPLFSAWDKSTGIEISEGQISDLGNYLTNETDPLFIAWDKSTGIEITESQITDLQNYLTDETDPLFSAWDKSTGIIISESQISDLGNYLTNETDPLFTSWDKSTGIEITESQITDLQNYLTDETDPLFSAWDKSTGIVITEEQISNLGDYITNETDPLFTAWDKTTGIEITESQITDLQNYITEENQSLADVLHINNSANNLNITELANPINAQDAATKAYVDLLEEKINALLAYYESFLNPPLITTAEIIEITSSTATGGGTVINNGGTDITSRGLVWHTEELPTLDNNTGYTIDSSGLGVFVSELTDLTPGTLYYVRAYATNTSGNGYGNQLEFTTLTVTPNSYNLNLNVSPTGSGEATGAGDYEEGAEVVINATANEGFEFVNWTSGEDTISTNASFTYTMPASDVTLNANFREISEPNLDGQPCPGMPTVTDIDGNVYNTVLIGEQCWIRENLKVTQYNNGTPIITGLSNEDWLTTTEGAYAIYPYTGGNFDNPPFEGINSDEDMLAIYGGLYNWYAVTNNYGLCPTGWRVPAKSDFDEIIEYAWEEYGINNEPMGQGLGMKLKSRRQVDSPLGEPWDTNEHPRWNSHSSRYGTDDFNFSAIPAGVRGGSGNYGAIGTSNYIWSTTEFNDENAWAGALGHVFGDDLNFGATYKKWYGYSVRCIEGLNNENLSYTLTTQSNIEEAGIISEGGTYYAGDEISLSATPSEGFEFINWTNGEEIISTEASFTYIMPASDVTLTANFEEANMSLTPVITTKEIFDITPYTAMTGGEILNEGSSEVTQKGIIWSQSENPTIESNDGFYFENHDSMDFKSKVTCLNSQSTYFVRAFATNTAGVGYGESKEFTTLSLNENVLVYDIDGNSYETTIIGNQEWLTKNLGTTRYNNCDSIYNFLEFEGSEYTTSGLYTVYPQNELEGLNSEIEVVQSYGALYNWYVIHDDRGVCPVGWNVPNMFELTALISYLGGYADAGGLLKSNLTEPDNHPRWDSPNISATNDYGFDALPAGIYSPNNNQFSNVGKKLYLRSSTETSIQSGFSFTIDLSNSGAAINTNPTSKDYGFSIRCFRQIEGEANLPTVITLPISNISSNSVFTGSDVVSDGGAPIGSRGLIWSKTGIPTVDENDGWIGGSGTGIDLREITNLESGTTYFIRAHATNIAGTAYGEVIEFATLDEDDESSWMPCPGMETVTDIDGNVYNTVLIGEQCWMRENLNVGQFITRPEKQTNNSIIEKYCYDDLTENCNHYGGLYVWGEALNYDITEGSQGICPDGWHVPTNSDWNELELYLGMSLEEINQTNYRGQKANLIKEGGMTGFDGLYSGKSFQMIDWYQENGEVGYWWSSTAIPPPSPSGWAWIRGININEEGILKTNGEAGNLFPPYGDLALPVRCIKTTETETIFYNLNIEVHPENGATSSGSGQYIFGEEVVISVTPNEGYEFVNWTYGDDIISTEASFTYTMPASDVTLTANFAEVEFDTFDFVIETISGQTEFSFVVDNAVDFHVNWGDGNTDIYTGNSKPTHDFGESGMWTIKVRGQASRIAFYNSQKPTHAKMLKDILTPVSKGITGITSAVQMFRNTEVESFTSENFFDEIAGNITDMRGMFQGSNFNQEIGHWDVGNVTVMHQMFSESPFNQNIGGWDVSSVTDMSLMFKGRNLYNLHPFNQDIGGWDVSNVVNMDEMFSFSVFNQDIGGWDVSSVSTMFSLFYFAPEFNQNISNWNVSNVQYMKLMFTGSAFNQNISNWDVSNVRNMEGMFERTPFNQDIGNWDVSKVAYMTAMFTDTPFNQYLSNWDVSKVESMGGMFYNTPFNQDIGDWDVSKVTNMGFMFANSPFNHDIGSWDVSQVQNFESMFQITPFNQDIGNWDTSRGELMTAMFQSTPFNHDIGNWDVSKVRCMAGMFNFSSFNQDISEWSVGNVINMSWMFYWSDFNQDISNWSVSNVIDFSNFLDESELSPENYNKLLINWSNLNLQQNVNFHGGNSKYDLGLPEERRQYIIDTFGWNITDGGTTGQPYQE